MRTFGIWFSIGQTGLHAPGISFADLEYALRADTTGGTITWQWWESGTNTGTVATTTTGDLAAWRIEYDGANGIEVFIDGVSVVTTTSSYTTEAMACYILGRDANGVMVDHVALKTVAQPNRILLPFGDSNTFGRATSGVAGGSYVYKSVAFTNHRHFVNPVVAVSGETTAQILSNQIPLRTVYYNASYLSNVATYLGGTNDLRISRSLALIQADIVSAISALNATGFTTVILTVPRDFSAADRPDRVTLNNWIIAGNSGADHVVDLTGTAVETDSGQFEVDGYHLNPTGMTTVATELWVTLNTL